MAITEKFYITYEELPYKYELLDINDMKNIYTKEVNKKEYPDFETWQKAEYLRNTQKKKSKKIRNCRHWKVMEFLGVILYKTIIYRRLNR